MEHQISGRTLYDSFPRRISPSACFTTRSTFLCSISSGERLPAIYRHRRKYLPGKRQVEKTFCTAVSSSQSRFIRTGFMDSASLHLKLQQSAAPHSSRKTAEGMESQKSASILASLINFPDCFFRHNRFPGCLPPDGLGELSQRRQSDPYKTLRNFSGTCQKTDVHNCNRPPQIEFPVFSSFMQSLAMPDSFPTPDGSTRMISGA